MKIGGRQFSVVDMERRTFRHDAHLLALIGRTGLDKLQPAAGEDAQMFSLRIFDRIVEQGAAAEIAAAFLLPEGMAEREWTAETAAAIQRHLERCDTEADRDEIYRIAYEVVIGFFRQRLRSLVTSLSAWNAAAESRNATAAA